MKNKIILLSILVISLVGIMGCENETTAGFTRTTYYPEIKIKGGTDVFVAKGTKYEDLGAVSTENGKEIETKVNDNVDTDKLGGYKVNYSATNTDGFSKTVVRNVYVYDGANVNNTIDIAGEYIGKVVRNDGKSYSDMTVTLSPTSVSGVYKLSDWIAGFYAVGYGYGDALAFTGVIQFNDKNEVVEVAMNNYWGNPFDSVTGTYDSSTGNINYVASWLGGRFVFTIDLTKK